MCPLGKDTRLIVDDELVWIFRHPPHLDAEGLENYAISLAIRLQSVLVDVGVTGTGKALYEGSLTDPRGWSTRQSLWSG